MIPALEKVWVNFDDAGWRRDLKTGTIMRLVMWRVAGLPTFYVVADEGMEGAYGADYEVQPRGARAILTGEDHRNMTGAATAVLQAFNLELERQRLADGISEADFAKIVSDPFDSPTRQVRPDGSLHVSAPPAAPILAPTTH